MCRFLSYTGSATLMDEFLLKSSNSLVNQSRRASLRDEPVNGDGFGVGWYPIHEDPQPGVFVSVEPAWSNRNLKQLASKVLTNHFFAHVRDASEGMPVSQANCHPYQYGNYLWMHNGYLGDFERSRRSLLNTLSDQAFDYIKGNTDTEHIFALFLDYLQFSQTATLTQMRQAIIKTIASLLEIRADTGATSSAMMNFAVTNGEYSLFTRFASDENTSPPSLFYRTGDETIVASEPLSRRKDWQEVIPGQLIIVGQSGKVTLSEINIV